MCIYINMYIYIYFFTFKYIVWGHSSESLYIYTEMSARAPAKVGSPAHVGMVARRDETRVFAKELHANTRTPVLCEHPNSSSLRAPISYMNEYIY